MALRTVHRPTRTTWPLIVGSNELEFHVFQVQVLSVMNRGAVEDKAHVASFLHVHLKCLQRSVEKVTGHPRFFVRYVGYLKLPQILEVIRFLTVPNQKANACHAQEDWSTACCACCSGKNHLSAQNLAAPDRTVPSRLRCRLLLDYSGPGFPTLHSQSRQPILLR